jgi:hypothetical protein
VKTFKFRETLELIKMGNPEPTPKKKERCRDSKEAVLTNGVDCAVLL